MSLKNLLDTSVKIGEDVFYGFNVYVVSLELSTSVTLKINAAFLKGGSLETKALNDGIYNYKSYSLTLKGDDYTKWGSDDSYIVDHIKSHFSEIVSSPDNVFRPFRDFMGHGQGFGPGLGGRGFGGRGGRFGPNI